MKRELEELEKKQEEEKKREEELKMQQQEEEEEEGDVIEMDDATKRAEEIGYAKGLNRPPIFD